MKFLLVVLIFFFALEVQGQTPREHHVLINTGNVQTRFDLPCTIGTRKTSVPIINNIVPVATIREDGAIVYDFKSKRQYDPDVHKGWICYPSYVNYGETVDSNFFVKGFIGSRPSNIMVVNNRLPYIKCKFSNEVLQEMICDYSKPFLYSKEDHPNGVEYPVSVLDGIFTSRPIMPIVNKEPIHDEKSGYNEESLEELEELEELTPPSGSGRIFQNNTNQIDEDLDRLKRRSSYESGYSVDSDIKVKKSPLLKDYTDNNLFDFKPNYK